MSMTAISVLKRLRQEDHKWVQSQPGLHSKFQASLSNMVKPCPQNQRQTNKKIRNKSQVPMTHAYNPSYSGGRDQEDCSSKSASGKIAWRHTYWVCVGGRGTKKKKKIAGGVAQVVRVPPLQAWDPEFKPQCCQKTKRLEKTELKYLR
jgi:hypothetical protein